MKKIATTLSVMTLALTLVACGGNAQSGVDANGGENAEEASKETVVQGEIAWKDADDAGAAAKDAGQSSEFVVPTPLPIGDYEWSEPNYTAMDKVVEAHCDGKGIGCTIRKGEGISLEDLSADLNEYKHNWDVDVDGIKVACHGYEEGIANFLEWERDGNSYDVWCVSTGQGNLGMNEEEVKAMVTGIK